MIATFRQSWKNNREDFLLKIKKLIINGIHFKIRSTYPFIRQQWATGYGLYWCFLHSERNKAPKTICNNIFLQKDSMKIGNKCSCNKVTKNISDPLSSFLFNPPWYYRWYLWPLLSQNFPPRSLSCPALPCFYYLRIVPTGKLLVGLGGGGDWRFWRQLSSVLKNRYFSIPKK